MTAEVHPTDGMTPRDAAPEPWAKGRHVVYRVYGIHGRLLYVGCSRRMAERWRDHRGTTTNNPRPSPWFKKARRVRIQIFPTLEAARLAEHRAIVIEAPLYNRNKGTLPGALRLQAIQ